MTTEKKEDWKLLFKRIKRQQIKSWFDLGIFLDKLQQRRFTFLQKPKDFKEFSSFTKFLSNGSFAFATYNLGVDGVSIEIGNYFKALKKLFPRRFKACLLVGDFDSDAEILKKGKEKIPIYKIPEAAGFEKWGEPYQFLYFHKLKRGGEIYNLLPSLIWKKSLKIIEKILNIIEKENIRCFVLSNIASNPGNLSLTLAVVIISEIFGIPVININHDFYWEDGKNPRERKKGERSGVRDHFFTNADLGEFFSIIKLLFPWRGRFWAQVNINKQQTKTLIEKEGLNPNDVTEIGTAIDPLEFKVFTAVQKERAYNKLRLLFSSLTENLTVFKPADFQIDRQAKKEQPLIIGWQKELDFDPAATLLFLQPTRIIKRKQIEKNFGVIKSLFQDKNFRQYLFQQRKKVLLLISGPIAAGHFNYFQKLKKEIINFYNQLPLSLKEIFFVGFKFGKDDNENFLSNGLEKLSIAELYGISDIVFLLSKTEGRGLPIIESSASGVALVVNRFIPYETYKEVIAGLKVFVYQDDNREMIKELIPFIISEKKREQLAKINRRVVKNRFTFEILKNQLVYILGKSWLQTKSDCQIRKISYQVLRKLLNLRKNSIKEIIWGKNKTYFPGYIPCGFLFYLKSLIDPSFFRIEQLDLKSRIFHFGRQLVDQVELTQKKRFLFFKAIEEIFRLTWGKEKTTIDHSFNYRNRTNKRYLFHQLTEYELEGVVVLLSQKIFGSQFDPFLKSGAKDKDFSNQLQSLRNYRSEWKWEKKLKFLFPEISSLNLDLFFKQVVNRSRNIVFFLNNSKDVIFDLKILTEELLTYQLKKDKPIKIYLIVSKKPFFNKICKNDLETILRKKSFSLLREYRRKGLIQILSVPVYSSGFNFYHLNKKAKNVLVSLKENNGLVFARGENNFITLDLLNIDSFCFGVVGSKQFSRFIGLAKNASFFQYIPAGLRVVLNYPVPSQQLLKFNHSLERAKNKKEVFWQEIKMRQDKTGENLKESIDKVSKNCQISRKNCVRRNNGAGFIFDKFAGKCQDGLPWTGAYFKFDYFQLRNKIMGLRFEIIKSQKSESLSQLITTLESQKKRKVLFGLNGGFILSNELVGKLGLTKEYIGIPLGLSIHKGKIFSLPLYNRPVFSFKKNGAIFIKRLTLAPGRIWMKTNKKQSLISWKKEQINPLSEKLPPKKIVVYNLLFDQKIPLSDRVLVTICGNKIAKVLRAHSKKTMFYQKELLPVGITLSFPQDIYDKHFSEFYQTGRQVNFAFKQEKEWQGVEEAIEAGPLLLQNGKVALNMKLEGWLTKHSISTQASRLDRLNQRGPKIALGISQKREIIGVVFNGRTRDSFGISYLEMAKILQNMGAWQAMAFDPGGSASLYIKRRLFNVPPYNPDYNQKIYYAPACSRPIANALVLTKST